MLMEVSVYRSYGFTFIEMLITIVVIGIALSALTSALSTSVVQGAAPIVEGKALYIAQAYVDEILPLKFDDQSPQQGGEVTLSASPCEISNESQTRSQFDDVDDYHGVTDSPPVLLLPGFNFDKYSNYAVSVEVTCAGLELGLAANHLMKRITVTVTTPENQDRVLSVYRGNF